MRSSVHPSPEALNAHFDQELPPEERAPIDEHLAACAECDAAVRSFAALAALTPEMDPALPGEAYWSDLPDRILARIVSDPVPVDPVERRWWSQLWSPAGGWRYAVGAAATVAMAGGAWWVLHDQPNLWRPDEGASTRAQNEGGKDVPLTDLIDRASPAGTDIASVLDGPAVSPETYNNRVVLSLGSDPGTPLDILPGQSNQSFSRESGIGTPVTEQLPPLSGRLVEEAGAVVGYGCGEDPLTTAYVNALRAEEEGNYRLAAIGYNTVRSALQPGMPLYHEADYRLNVLAWRDRMQRTYAMERGQVLADLHNQMMQAINAYEKSGSSRDCQKAHCMTRVFIALGPEVQQPKQLQVTQVRMQELDCNK
jgi:hypothetical protein